MKFCFTLLSTLSLLILSQTAPAQETNRSISGLVKDIQNEPAPNATIRLLQAADSAVVQTKMAKGNGRFEFTGLNKGTYLLSITAAGMKPYTSSPLALTDQRAAISLPAVILVPNKKGNLQEVTVTAKKPLIEQDIDKTIVNVESMVSASTSNTLEVLEKTPGIIVDANGEISLNGANGVNVLIDGRPTYMSGRDLAAYLRSLPGGMLDKIELMPNPPAKYDANGGAIINIRLKRKRTQGYVGSVNLNYNQGKLARSYNSLNLNYVNRKVNVFGNFSYGRYSDYYDDVSNRSFYTGSTQKNSGVELRTYSTSGSNEWTGRMGMDYTLSPKTTIGMIVNGGGRRRLEEIEYTTNSYTIAGTTDSIGLGTTDNRSTWQPLGVNLNFQHKFDNNGREFTADINYINYHSTGNQLLENEVNLPSGDPISNSDFLYRLPSDIDIYTARADYSHPLKNKASISGGWKSSLVENDNLSEYFALQGNTELPDYGRSNHFIYRENINAAYINGRKDWKRFGMQLGLRVEHTHTNGQQMGNAIVAGSSFSNDYTGLFPTVFLSYKLDSLAKHNLTVNYSRRINRPGYQQLNPFLFFVDQYSFSTGNPTLKPAYGNSLQVGYRYKQLFNAIFNVERITDGFYGAQRVEDNTIITRSENIGTRQMIALLTYTTLNPTKWWNFTFQLAGAQFRTSGQLYSEKLDLKQLTWRTTWMNQFRIGKDWSGELFAAYNAPNINWQRKVQSRYWVNIALQKKVLKGKGNLKVNVEDIFHSLKWQEETKGLKQATMVRTSTNDTQRVGLSFSYSFGKETFARKRRYNDNTADDVKERAQ
ncbi:outer membrane beta-barrel protein [Paraflavitalea sp. CAU 1676]|uniref:outer membrane beta-barrel protein n=1 Tax=Paraflavitalea sp. CAU 1676 TaxID=3032598 RepID=UPI0023DB2F5D|nr:outer membrane beta-barrel protein [Paraflavitalea sp. CAU 1676]MDF2190396.1 TonB-dependent receptor [Paraflavitalea sp. CAU 1676]